MKKIGAEELMQACLEVENVQVPATQTHIRAALEKTPGVHSIHLVEGKLLVVYDPLATTRFAVEEIIRGCGHRVLGGRSERQSHFADNHFAN